MSDDKRVITQDYLQVFVETIAKGGRVTFVEESNLLAVDHPSMGYLVLQIADEVEKGKQDELEQTNSTTE